MSFQVILYAMALAPMAFFLSVLALVLLLFVSLSVVVD